MENLCCECYADLGTSHGMLCGLGVCHAKSYDGPVTHLYIADTVDPIEARKDSIIVEQENVESHLPWDQYDRFVRAHPCPWDAWSRW